MIKFMNGLRSTRTLIKSYSKSADPHYRKDSSCAMTLISFGDKIHYWTSSINEEDNYVSAQRIRFGSEKKRVTTWRGAGSYADGMVSVLRSGSMLHNNPRPFDF